MTDDTHRLLTLCALDGENGRIDWSLIAREAVRAGGLDRLYQGEILEDSIDAKKALPLLRQSLDIGTLIATTNLDRARKRVDDELVAAQSVGATLFTVLDSEYPTNLRVVPNLPPFIFMLGESVGDRDIRSVAVVGTRKPSSKGIELAQLMARGLVAHGVTVISGLAAGIDTAAHRATLDEHGRTIAVIGTGITRTYPKVNEGLASDILASGGSIISQFWPDSPPARWTFPRRNAVMSGLGQGTVVVEASSTSGAKMQARLALEHNKKLFLLRRLVAKETWAQNYQDKPGVVIVSKVSDVIDQLTPVEQIRRIVGGPQQLSLADNIL